MSGIPILLLTKSVLSAKRQALSVWPHIRGTIMGIPSAAATTANVSRSSMAILPPARVGKPSAYTARRHRPVTRYGRCQTLVGTDMDSFHVAGRDCTARATGPVRSPARRRPPASVGDVEVPDQHQHLAVVNMNLGSESDAFRPRRGASGCLARRLPLQPTLHPGILADGDVEPHPRRALEVRSEDGTRRQHDAVALRRFRQRERVIDLREPRPDEHAVGGFYEQLQPHAFESAHDIEARLPQPLVQT